MNISRRKATAVLASIAAWNIPGCGGTSDSTTQNQQSKPAKVAFDSSRNTSTFWSDDGALILIGPGDYRLSEFKFERGRISDATTKIDLIIESPTKIKFLSTDRKGIAIFDTSDTTLKTIRHYWDGKFVAGYGFYNQGSQTYIGEFNTDRIPTVDQLTNKKPIQLKTTPSPSTLKQSTLARITIAAIPSAYAETDTTTPDSYKRVENNTLELLVSFGVLALSTLAIAVCTNPICILAGLVGTIISVSLIKTRSARADETPPRLPLSELPPAGSIPYGTVVYVDDGGCPAGQLKMVTGGNQQLGIPRKIACVPTPATVP